MKVKTVLLLLKILAVSIIMADPIQPDIVFSPDRFLPGSVTRPVPLAGFKLPPKCYFPRFVNVAVRGTATQSTVLSINTHSAALSQADHAIDGNRDSNWLHGSCSSTAVQYRPWWRVDLGQVYKIGSVTITARADRGAELPNGAQIRIGYSLRSNGNTNPVCRVISSLGRGQTKTFRCTRPLKGRYVNVYLPRKGCLQLCEVEANISTFNFPFLKTDIAGKQQSSN